MPWSSICPICHTEAFIAESVEYEDTLYHAHCMLCCVCRHRLAKKRINHYKGKFYCPAHTPVNSMAMSLSMSQSVGNGVPFTRVIFDKYDFDGTGSIDANELMYMCREMGHYMTPEEAVIAVKVIDREGTGEISYELFHEWWSSEEKFQKVTFSQQMLAYLNAAITSFMAYDSDGNGTISRAEFSYLHQGLVGSTYKTTTEQADWDAMDSNHNGSISFAEYRDWLLANAPKY